MEGKHKPMPGQPRQIGGGTGFSTPHPVQSSEEQKPSQEERNVSQSEEGKVYPRSGLPRPGDSYPHSSSTHHGHDEGVTVEHVKAMSNSVGVDFGHVSSLAKQVAQNVPGSRWEKIAVVVISVVEALIRSGLLGGGSGNPPPPPFQPQVHSMHPSQKE